MVEFDGSSEDVYLSNVCDEEATKSEGGESIRQSIGCNQKFCDDLKAIKAGFESKAAALKDKLRKLRCDASLASSAKPAPAAPVVAGSAAPAAAGPAAVEKKSGGLPGWAIALIVVGAVLLIGGVGAYFYFRKN